MTEERDGADGAEDAARGREDGEDAARGSDGDGEDAARGSDGGGEDAARGSDGGGEDAARGSDGGGEDAGGLGARERDLLAVERRSWPGPGAKERAVRERLGLSPTRYYQLLNALLDDPRALAHDPVTVNRLRRVRDEKRAKR
ncbi:DUF3263 domain-containing protein [Streptomyces venezuelae]|uniref:DUF3263 domain-containing protein n=1 Tax=Streptomyces venezuelae TaxID=54571 RepID=UPI00123CDA4C|nr:DUF3263 domain-containing protein [Streptomyces venezuelae]QES13806.1 DUF3263 domain-containing protein [Streptomyces venezuelae]